MMSLFFKGVLDSIFAITDLFKYRLIRYLLISGLLSVVAAVLSFRGIDFLITKIGIWIYDISPWKFDEFTFKWSSSFEWVPIFLGYIITFSLVLLVAKYVILIVSSPIMSLVSNKIENELTGTKTESKFGLAKEVLRGLRISVGSIIRELPIVIGLFLATLIFPIGAIVFTLLALLVQAYYAGFGCLDYYLEKKHGVSESLAIGKQHRAYLCGVGLVYVLLMYIPIIGWFLAPTLGTVSTTKYGVTNNL